MIATFAGWPVLKVDEIKYLRWGGVPRERLAMISFEFVIPGLGCVATVPMKDVLLVEVSR